MASAFGLMLWEVIGGCTFFEEWDGRGVVVEADERERIICEGCFESCLCGYDVYMKIMQSRNGGIANSDD